MYINFDEYTALYDPIEERDFNRLVFQACQAVDNLTTGVDGVKKLRVAFPANEDNATAVKHCVANVTNILYQIQEAEKSAFLARGYMETANGLQGKVVSSVSAGNESVSFSSGGGSTAVDKAVTNIAERNRMIQSIVREYLSGVTDANGVNLLYMGVYPRV
jgi:prophage DNA circulation protein